MHNSAISKNIQTYTNMEIIITKLQQQKKSNKKCISHILPSRNWSRAWLV